MEMPGHRILAPSKHKAFSFVLEAINTGLIVLHTGDPDSFLGYLESEGKKKKKELKMLQTIN